VAAAAAQEDMEAAIEARRQQAGMEAEPEQQAAMGTDQSTGIEMWISDFSPKN